MDKNFLLAFKQNWLNYKIAMKGLELSYQHSLEIGLKSEYSFAETEVYDALIIKLSRNSDLFFQQIIKAYCKLKGEDALTLIDRLHLFEKMNVWENAENLLQLKSFRNQAVHEYASINFEQLYADAISLSAMLLSYTEQFEQHIKKEIDL